MSGAIIQSVGLIESCSTVDSSYEMMGVASSNNPMTIYGFDSGTGRIPMACQSNASKIMTIYCPQVRSFDLNFPLVLSFSLFCMAGTYPESSGMDYSITVNMSEVIPRKYTSAGVVTDEAGPVGTANFDKQLASDPNSGFVFNIHGMASMHRTIDMKLEIPVGVITSNRGALLLILTPVAYMTQLQEKILISGISISGVPRYEVQYD
jgi:hypothetical protein